MTAFDVVIYLAALACLIGVVQDFRLGLESGVIQDGVFLRAGYSQVPACVALAAAALFRLRKSTLGYPAGAVGALLGLGSTFYQSRSLSGTETGYLIFGLAGLVCLVGTIKVRRP